AFQRYRVKAAALRLLDLVVAHVKDLGRRDLVLTKQFERRLEHAGAVVVNDHGVALAGDDRARGLLLLGIRSADELRQPGGGHDSREPGQSEYVAALHARTENV